MKTKQHYTKGDMFIIVGSVVTIGLYYLMGVINVGWYVSLDQTNALLFIGYTFLGVVLVTVFLSLQYWAIETVTEMVGKKRTHIRLHKSLGVDDPQYKKLKIVQTLTAGLIMIISNLVALTLINKNLDLPSTLSLLVRIQLQVLPFIYAILVVLEDETGLREKLEHDIEGY